MKFRNNPLVYVLLIAAVVKISLLKFYSALWWDEAVYVGMAKFLYSAGYQGLWEPIRPVLWPMIIGLFKWANILVIARFLEFLCYLGIIVLTYLIAEKVFNKKVAFFSSLIIASSPTLFFFSYKSLTNVPGTLIILLATYWLLNKKYLYSGFALAAAFLIRFPLGIFILPAAAYVFFSDDKRTRIRHVSRMCVAFLSPILIYLISNKIAYGSFTMPLRMAKWVINNSNIWLYNHNWGFYIAGILRENFIYIFALLGMFAILGKGLKRSNKDGLLIAFMSLPLILYFSFLPHQEMRFIISALPFLAILSAYVICNVIHEINENRMIFFLIVVLILLKPFFIMPLYAENQEQFNFRLIKGDLVLTSDPRIAVYSDAKIDLLYYPLFTEELIEERTRRLEEKGDDIDNIYINSCNLVCPPDNYICEIEKQRMIKAIESNYNLIYESEDECKVQIFTS